MNNYWKIENHNGRKKYYLKNFHPTKYLTQREAEVVCYIHNRTYADIARVLNLSKRTIELYAKNIMVKFNCSSKRELKGALSEEDSLALSKIIPKNEAADIQLLDVNKLRPHECVDNEYIMQLHKEILKAGYWSSPIIVDKENYIVMDGHHRLEVAKKIKLNRIPCVILAYQNNDVTVFHTNTDKAFDIAVIKDAAMTGNRLAKKSTQHRFNIEIEKINVPLEILF